MVKIKIKSLLYVLLVVVVFFVGYSSNPPVVYELASLDVSGVVSCGTSIGESMFYPDDAVHLYGKPENLSVGDVVYFKKDDHFVIHRLVNIEEINGTYTTRGDNNRVEDKPIKIEDIKYKVLKTIYFGG